MQGAACEVTPRTVAATPAPGARQASARGRELQRSRPPRFGACTRAHGVGRARSAGDQQQPARTAAVKQCPATGSASDSARQAEEASSLGESRLRPFPALQARVAIQAPRARRRYQQSVCGTLCRLRARCCVSRRAAARHEARADWSRRCAPRAWCACRRCCLVRRCCPCAPVAAQFFELQQHRSRHRATPTRARRGSDRLRLRGACESLVFFVEHRGARSARMTHWDNAC